MAPAEEALEGLRAELQAELEELRTEVAELRELTSSANSSVDALVDEVGGYRSIADGKFREIEHALYPERELVDLTLPLSIVARRTAFIQKVAAAGITQAVLDDLAQDVKKPNDKPRVCPADQATVDGQARARFLALTFRNALSLYVASRGAPLQTRPILEFYSAEQLGAFLTGFVFDFAGPPKHHGLSFGLTPAQPAGEAVITVGRNGAFARFAVSLACFGRHNPVSPRVVFRGPGGILSGREIQPVSFALGNQISVADLCAVDCARLTMADVHGTVYGDEPAQIFADTADLLQDFLILFAASNLARYWPDKWASVCSGDDSLLAREYLHASRSLGRLFERTGAWTREGQDQVAIEPLVAPLATQGALP